MAFADQTVYVALNADSGQLDLQVGPSGESIDPQAILDILSGNDQDPRYLAWQFAQLLAANFSPVPAEIDGTVAAFLNGRHYKVVE